MTQTKRLEKVKINLPEKEKANVTLPCLVAVCRGNDNIADLLNYFLWSADQEAKRIKVEEVSTEITLQLSHDEILNRPNNEGKRFNFSERSLIAYLKRLDEWKLVTSSKYGRSQIVHIDAINEAIANPPAKPKGKPRGKRKSGNVEENKDSAKSSTLVKRNVELELKVEMLQEKVETLQLKVDMFQDFVEKFQLSKSQENASQNNLEAKKVSVYSVDTIYSIDFFTGACESIDEAVDNTSTEEKNTEVSSMSYSQETNQPATEEKVEVTPSSPQLDITVPAQSLGYKQDNATSQGSTGSVTSSQGKSSGLNIQRGTEQKKQDEKNKPSNYTFPDLTNCFKPDIPDLTTTPKKTKAQIQQRMADIIALADKEVGTRVPRSPKKFVGEALEDLVDGDYSDEQIVFCIQDLKANKKAMRFEQIASNMADAVLRYKQQQSGVLISFERKVEQRNQHSRYQQPVVPPQKKYKNYNDAGNHLTGYDDEEVVVMHVAANR